MEMRGLGRLGAQCVEVGWWQSLERADEHVLGQPRPSVPVPGMGALHPSLGRREKCSRTSAPPPPPPWQQLCQCPAHRLPGGWGDCLTLQGHLSLRVHRLL